MDFFWPSVIVVVAGWFVLSVIVMCVWRNAMKDEHVLMFAVFGIFTWPAWLAIAILGLPVALGMLVGMLVRELASQFNEEKTVR